MDDQAAAATAPQQDLESRFLAAVAQSPVPAGECLAMLAEAASAHPESVGKMAFLLRDQLVEAGMAEDLAKLFSAWAGWATVDRPSPSTCREDLKRASKDRLWNAIVDSCSFGDRRVDFTESMRRFNLLRACKPGTACLDRTWGFGIVKRMDDFYKRMTIDFDSKKNQAMPFAVAAESLEILSESHILLKRHNDRAAFERRMIEKPGDVVVDLLASFGQMSLTRMENVIRDNGILPFAGYKASASGKASAPKTFDEQWKAFWEAARRDLKTNKFVEIPAKRSDMIVLHATPPVLGDKSWIEALAVLRDPARILEQVQKLESEAPEMLDTEDARAAIASRMKFALTGARNADNALYSRLAVVAARLGIEDPSPAETRAQLWRNGNYLNAAEKLSARDVGHLVGFLLADAPGSDGRQPYDKLLEALPKMNYAMVAETLDQLRRLDASNPASAALRSCIGDSLAKPNPPQTVLVWVLRNILTLRDPATLAPLDGWRLPSNYELLGHALAVSEDRNLTGETLRMRNAIDSLLSSTVKKGGEGDWFQNIFCTLEQIQQEAIFDHVQRATSAWDPAMQRGLVGRMLKVNPELKARKATALASAELSKPAGRWTSLRSRAERERDLERLVKVDIPENVKAIEYGRSLGDLRENFEYQSAKDNERILHQRRESWEEDLRSVKATDFAEIVPEVAGMGSKVTLRFDDGSTRVCNILGEWDHDEALSIYSNKSGLALSLEGKKAGDKASVPTEDGEKPATIESVEPLDAAVREWSNTLPPPFEAPAAAAPAEPAPQA